MDCCALNNALERRCRYSFGSVNVSDQIGQFFVDEFNQRGAQFIAVDGTSLHDFGGVWFIKQREQQVLKRCEFVIAIICQRKRGMDRLF